MIKGPLTPAKLKKEFSKKTDQSGVHPRTLAKSTLIILFSAFLEFSKMNFSKYNFFCGG
jgi:hypothetical protein